VAGGDDGDGRSDSVSPVSTTAATRGSNLSGSVDGVADGEVVYFSQTGKALDPRKGEAHLKGVSMAVPGHKPRFDVESAIETAEAVSGISSPPDADVDELDTVEPDPPDPCLAVAGQVSEVEGVREGAGPVEFLVAVRITLPDSTQILLCYTLLENLE